jgi:hypothetical protein
MIRERESKNFIMLRDISIKCHRASAGLDGPISRWILFTDISELDEDVPFDRHTMTSIRLAKYKLLVFIHDGEVKFN